MAETNIKAGREEQRYYPYSGTFHLTRNSFWEAGQDSYTQAPAQNPDLFTLLTNVEPITQGTLQHRRGYTLFNIPATTQPFTRAYAFRNDSLGLRRYVWTSFGNVFVTDEAGVTLQNPLFTPSFTAGAIAPRMVLSRDYGYFSDLVQADYLKWNGQSAMTKWGISGGQVVASTIGPNAPTNATSISNSIQGGGGVAWNNPGNVEVADGVYATCLTGSGNFSQILFASGFSFASVGLIVGIKVDIKYTAINPANAMASTSQVYLFKNGTVVGQPKTLVPIPVTNTQISFGNSSDLWGTTWLPGDINASNFGVGLITQGSGAGVTFEIDYIQVTVYELAGSITVGAPGVGAINLLSGRTYFTCFQNTTTGTNGPLSTASASTGPLTARNVPLSNIPVSTDPQVDTVNILATADGNDQTTLFLLGSVMNGVTTFTDNVPDPVLLTQPLFQFTDAQGVLHGVANNNPPPAADFPTKHKGRIYMAKTHTLYFSKNLDEVTTSTGTITSKWEEAWPLTNSLDISETAETVQALLSDGETLWIGTERAIRRLIGDSPQNFQKPEVQFNETGVLNQEVWKVVFYEGQPVGTMWLTPDNRVFTSDFNTYQDVGRDIQDILNTINHSATIGPHASFVSNGAFDLYMLYLPIGADLQPSTICVFNMRTKKWVVWKPFDLVTASLFNINAAGIPQWLFATQQTNLYFWDPATIIDRNGVGGAFAVPAIVRSSWLSMGDETLKKALNQQIIYTDDHGLTLTIEGAIQQDDLVAASPPVVASNLVVRTGPLGGYLFTPLAGTNSKHNWYRFTWNSNNTGVLLGAYNTECIPLLRI